MRNRNSIVLKALHTMAILLCASSILGWSQTSLSTVLYSSGTTAQYYVNTNSHIEEIFNNPNGTFGYQDNTALSGAPPAGFGSSLATALFPTGVTAQYFLSPDRHVQAILNNPNGTVTHQDTTALSGAPIARVGSPISTVLYSNGTIAQYFISAGSHVVEIISNPDGTNSYQDNTALTGAPLAGTGSPLATLLYSSGTTAQYYLSSAGHVQEIWNNPDGTFGYQDNTALAGAPAAAASSPLSIVLYSTGTTAQYCLTSGGHVVEIINNPNGTVSYQDNTSLTGAPVAAGGSPLATVLYSSGTTAQYYLSSDGHVQEIWNNPDSTFGHQDNTVLAGSPTARPGSPLRTVLYSTGTTAQYFLTSSGHVVEIINNPNGTVSYQDNTSLTGAPVAR